MRVASVGCFPEALRRGSWHYQVANLHLQSSMNLSLSASHYFSFLSKRSGRRIPLAERSAKRLLGPAVVIGAQQPRDKQPIEVNIPYHHLTSSALASSACMAGSHSSHGNGTMQ